MAHLCRERPQFANTAPGTSRHDQERESTTLTAMDHHVAVRTDQNQVIEGVLDLT